MKKNLKYLWSGMGFLILFAVWTILVQTVDVKAIGPEGSQVGFAAMNGWCHEALGVNMALYGITDLLGSIPLLTVFGFALRGLCQWIKGKSLRTVDGDIFLLGGFYLAVAGAFLLFEILAVNYRPILIEGVLEASYPSSTTLLTTCVMPSAVFQLRRRMKNERWKRIASIGILLFTLFMVVARLFSGVHWLSDIIGGILLSFGLILLYRFGEVLLTK